MKRQLKEFIKHHAPWVLRLNRPAGGYMAKMNPDMSREEKEQIFFESGRPFMFQNSRHHAIQTQGGSRCSFWDGLLFFSRPEGKPSRLFWPPIQHTSRNHVESDALLATLYALSTPTEAHEFIKGNSELVGSPPASEPERDFAPQLEALIRQCEERYAARCIKERDGHMPHLVLVTHGLSSGGAERQWCYLAGELARRGFAVSLLVDNLREQNAHYLPLLADTAVSIHTLEDMKIAEDDCPAGLQDFPYRLARYVLALRFLKPTHVLCQLDMPNLLAGAGALLADCGIEKILLSFRNVNPSHFDYIYSPWMLPWYKALLTSPRVILSGNSSRGNADYAAWLGAPESQVACIPNAFLPGASQGAATREEMRRVLAIASDAPVILGVFRLSEEKNPSLFLHVAKQLSRTFPNLVVLHAGEGHAAESVQATAREMGLSSRVRFLGRREDVPDLMRAADLLLLCSNHEGLPNVLLEAQAAKLPVVTTNAGSSQDAVRDGETALTADCGDMAELARHCEFLLKDPAASQRMGEAGRTFVLRTFTLRVLGDTTLQALDLYGAPDGYPI